jgi:CubicO group peptidase (beta-lactamase class C family)
VTARPFARADETVREALGSRFTAAVLRVERGGALAFESAYGAVDDAPDARTIDGGTRFDLASLTKIFVATAALRAVARGALSLDAPLAAGPVPEWRGSAHEPITLRALLAHVSGMQSGADYRKLLGADVECFALEQPLVAAPFERVVYSDLGFISLGVVLARVARRSLADVVAETCAAAGCEDTAFRPATRGEIPATEDDGWRGRVRGAVHDEKAYLLNGVAGHAGLFGSARDVAQLAEAYLGPLHGRAARVVPAPLAAEAVTEAAYDPVLRRGLGWALKTTAGNSCGALAAKSTFGHTGFTGTCMWADPVRDVSIVFLTNAVYYGREDMRAVRAAVCDAVFAAVDA